MLFERLQSLTRKNSGTGGASFALGLSLGLGLLALAPGLARQAAAQNPNAPSITNPVLTATPWSWPTFKQNPGTTTSANYHAANDSVPSVLADSAQTIDTVGAELRGFVLGDYGLYEPTDFTNSTYNFYEVANQSSLTASNVTGWVGPLYALSNDRDACIETVDNSGAASGYTTETVAATGTFTSQDAGTDEGQVGTDDDAAPAGDGATFLWTLHAPAAGYYTIYANIPGTGTEIASNLATATYTVAINGTTYSTDTVDQQNRGYQLVGGVTTAAAATITVTLGGTVGAAGDIVADAIQLREPQQNTVDNNDTGTAVPFTLSNGTNPFVSDIAAQDYIGSDYLSALTIARGGTNTQSTATWTFTAPQTGAYSLSVYYPVEYGSTGTSTSFTPEYYSIDAEYSVTIGGVALPAVTVDQTRNGGEFNKIIGPFNVLGGDTITLTLDNTSNNTNYEGENRIVVADAAQLNPDAGVVYGSPVAANTTNDDTELGYNPVTNVAGSQPTGYYAPYIDSVNGAEDPAIEVGGALPIVSQPHGDETNPAAQTDIPIAQITYFGRTESLAFTGANATDFTPGLSQQSGAVYAADGLSGNSIWKYGGNDTTIANPDTVTGNFAAGVGGTEVYGPSYYVATTVNSATPNSTATWTLPISANSGTVYYNVYIWVPTQGPAETGTRPTNASYTVGGTAAVGDQTQFGQWTPLTNTTANPQVFPMSSTADTVVLGNNYTDDNHTVAADAVLFVPLGNPGPVMSTPLLVRNMNLTNPADPAGATITRDVIIFTDNLGKMYCVDAAGNRDANNTLVDGDGNVYALDGAGYPAERNTNGNPSPIVSYSGGGYNVIHDVYTGVTLAPNTVPLTIADYGTTTVYWIWQPSASSTAVILHTALASATNDSTETVPDSNRDMPAPGSFLMNSPTVALAPSGSGYNATIFVGNTNGTVYSLNGLAEQPAQFTATPTATQPTDATVVEADHQYRLSQDTTTLTPPVNWWFSTGESIAYAPVFDPTPVNGTTAGHVYVTTYSRAFNNQGHLYSIDAANGGTGNGGVGFYGPASSNVPGSYNYNVNSVSFWSFPDKYGTVNNGTLPGTQHIDDSNVANGADPALPLGDMAGEPTVENIDGYSNPSTGVTTVVPHILVCANDPGPPDSAGNTGFGRVYSVTLDGKMNWAFPATDAATANTPVANQIGPDNVGLTDATTYDTVYTQPDVNGYAPAENDFTTEIIADDTSHDALFVSSSPAAGLITFPSNYTVSTTDTPETVINDVTNFNALAGAQVPMAYVGTLGGHVVALDLDGGIANLTNDPGGFLVSDTTVGDSAPIYSAPALLPGSAGLIPLTTTGDLTGGVGGVVFVNAGDPALYELEALPTTVDADNLPVEPQYFEYSSIGAVSSPTLAAFDTSEFVGINGQTVTGAAAGNVEFVYSGSDDGYCYGLTPNGTTSNTGGGGTGFFNPGGFIGSGALPPNNANTNAPNKYILVRVTVPTNTGGDYKKSYGSETSALYDWGQTACLQVYGVYPPAATENASPGSTPLSLSLSYSLSGGGKQTGGSTTVFLDTADVTASKTTGTNIQGVTIVPAINIPLPYTPGVAPPLGGYLDANQTYVATFARTIGKSTEYLPGSRRSLRNLTLNYLDTNGVRQQIRLNQGSAVRFRNSANSPASTIRISPLPATLTILNPLAVAGAGKTLDQQPSEYPTIGELGPFGGLPTNFYAASAANNPNLLRLVGEPEQEAMVNGNPVLNGNSSLVAVGLGDIAHNTAGDSSLPYEVDPASNSSETDPAFTAASATGETFGSSLLLVADRSAQGTIGQSIGDVYMSNDNDTQLAWNDNSGQQGPGSIINNLSWDTAPVDQHSNPTGNASADYPNISASNLSTALVARQTTANTSAIVTNPQGVAATITNSPGTLAPVYANGGGPGDPVGDRTVYPMPAIVKVAVPKYQPANLEVLTANGVNVAPTEVPHTQIAPSNGTYPQVPEGYYAKSRIYIDLSQSTNGTTSDHHFDPNTAAYREVAVLVGVPVDMGMSIDQPTVDLGTVTAGFADQVAQGGAAIPWRPYARESIGNPSATTASSDIYSQYYQPLTIRNNGNVNLYNVHIDQNIQNRTGVAPSYIKLVSDQNATPYGAANYLDSADWTDSLSFIPSVDNSNNLLLNGSSFSSLLLRSSLDTDVYLPNPNEIDLQNGSGSGHATFTNATLHKARPGDAASSVLTVPDEPHDSGNTAYYPNLSSLINSGMPVVGMAVPLGTPVGTYSGTIRAYEGSDPYDPGQPAASATSGLSGFFTGPNYSLAKAQKLPEFYLSNTGVPEQYYSEPGTTLKIGVRESQFTDGPPLVGAVVSGGPTGANAPFLALPSGDAGPAATNGSGGALPTTDVQPFAFSIPTNSSNLSNMGLLFISNREEVKTAGSVTANPNETNTFDLYSSALAPSNATGSALTEPSGTGKASWWTTPTNQTSLAAPSGNSTVSPQVNSPFVLSYDANDTLAFFVLRSVGSQTTVSGAGTSATAAPVYTIYEAAVSSPSTSGLAIDAKDATVLYTSTDPIFGVHAAAMPDTAGGEHLVVTWQARVRGRSRIEYLTRAVNGNITSSTAEGTAPQELPVSASLVDVQNPSPVLRFIAAAPGNIITALSNKPVTQNNANYLDVTYSGTLQDGTTDLYTSRYYLAPGTGSGSSSTPPTLKRIAVVPQNNAASATNPFTTVTLTLTRSGTDTGLFYARDVDWAASLSAIIITSTGGSAGTIISGSGGTAQKYTYDKASGQIVYTGVYLPWTATGTLSTVYVNPGLGTVRFSVPPTDPTTVIQAQVVPLSARVTYNSRVNTEPVAFLDDTLEQAFAVNAAPQAVNVSREWFIYRKSGSASGTTSASNNTLYYDTRRLTVNLAGTTDSNGVPTTSIATTTYTNNGASYTALASGFSVSVSATPTGAGTDVTQLVDVDAARARVYFPSDMEGLYATVKYTDQAGTAVAGTPQQIEWQDEPYVNAQSPSAAAVGEHVLPIATAANESNPSAFLDPTSGQETSNGVSIFTPHRVWVFWSSTRNANGTTGAGTGSDIYYEAIDPKFTPDVP